MGRCWVVLALVVFLGGGCMRRGVTIEIERPPEVVCEWQFVLVVDDVWDAVGPPLRGTFFQMRMVVAPKGSPPELWLQHPKPGDQAGHQDRPWVYQEAGFGGELGRETTFLAFTPGSGEAKLVLLEPGELRLLRPAKGGMMIKVTVFDWDPVAQRGRMDVDCVWGDGSRALAFSQENVGFRIGKPIVLYEEQPEAARRAEAELPALYLEGLGD